MMPHDPNHLTADELDSFLTGATPQDAASHVATCASCAAMVAADRRVVAALSALRAFDPAPGLQERIMAALVPTPVAPVAAVESPRASAARHRAIGGAILAGGALAGGFAWAAVHPDAAIRWAGPPLQGAGHALWISLQTVVANATAQPWFSSLRETLESPARAAGLLAAVAGAYAVGLVGLRRVMTEPAPHAGW